MTPYSKAVGGTSTTRTPKQTARSQQAKNNEDSAKCCKKHLFRIGLNDQPTCRGFALEDETTLHILCHCMSYATGRRRLLGGDEVLPDQVMRAPLKTSSRMN
ncbi:hypothetical protein D910_06034 [Dendroctonus ponderosae]